MATKIAFMKFKGGVASSSNVSTIAGLLKEKYRVLVVDCDPQDTQRTLMNSRDRAPRDESMAGILVEGFEAEKCVINVCENLDLVQAGGKTIETFNRKNKASAETSVLIKKALEPIEQNYDYILFDGSPTMSLIHQNILCYADFVLIPCDMDILSLSSTRSVVNFVEGLSKSLFSEGLSVATILGVIPVRFDSRRLVDDSIIQDLYSLEDNDLLGGGKVFSPIRDSANMKTAQVRRKFLTSAFPKSKIAEDYRKLTDEILKEAEERSLKGVIPNKFKTTSLEARV